MTNGQIKQLVVQYFVDEKILVECNVIPKEQGAVTGKVIRIEIFGISGKKKREAQLS